METRSRAKLKRQNENDENEQRKSQRLAASSAEPEHTTEINDLNDDCLLKIFGYLDGQSLFDVAIANAFLRPAACDVYKRKFGKMWALITCSNDFNPKSSVNAQNGDDAHEATEYGWCSKIIVSGFKACLLYLRIFGPSITNLMIDYSKSLSKRYGYVQQYINEYCVDSLISIKFRNMPTIAIEQFRKVFARVEHVVIFESDLGEQWSSFVELFPNLRCLKIYRMDIGRHGVAIKKPFKYLEHLEIIDCNTLTSNQLAADLLHGVRKLKSLQITCIHNDGATTPIHTLMDMIKENASITKFVYSFDVFKFTIVFAEDVQRIISEHAALIELRLKDYIFWAADAIALIRQHKSMAEFQFQLFESEQIELVSQLADEWNINVERTKFSCHIWVILKRKV